MTDLQQEADRPLEGFVVPHPTACESSFPPDQPGRGRTTWHTLVSSSITPSNALSAGIAAAPPGSGFLACHRHEQAELYYILAGEGEVSIDGVKYQVKEGDTVYIPGNAEHGSKNTSETAKLKYLYVFPTDAFEDVHYRFTHEQKESS